MLKHFDLAAKRHDEICKEAINKKAIFGLVGSAVKALGKYVAGSPVKRGLGALGAGLTGAAAIEAGSVAADTTKNRQHLDLLQKSVPTTGPVV